MPEILWDFNSCTLPLDYLLHVVGPQKAREFSISSTQISNPSALEITMGVTRYKTKTNRKKEGVCSGWLSRAQPENGDSVPIWIKEGTMNGHEGSPLVLVGPGTGVAPFRAIVKERVLKGETASTLLFYGGRWRARDFLYEHEWRELEKQSGGGFELVACFSRDQEHKVYV